MGKVFLSHAGRDHAKAKRLQQLLIDHDVPVWFSAHDIHGAKQWQDEIGEALAECDWFMLVLTPHAVNSIRTKFEAENA